MSSFSFDHVPTHCHYGEPRYRATSSKTQQLSYQKQYTRAVLPLLSKIINMKIEKGEYNASQYEGLLDNLNRYIILNLDESGLKFEKPIPRLTCDCDGCRQKIRAMKGRMSDAFFHKEGSPICSEPRGAKNSKISMQSYLYSKVMEKGSESKKLTRDSMSSVFRSQLDKTKREIMEDKMKHKKRLIEQAHRLA